MHFPRCHPDLTAWHLPLLDIKEFRSPGAGIQEFRGWRIVGLLLQGWSQGSQLLLHL